MTTRSIPPIGWRGSYRRGRPQAPLRPGAGTQSFGKARVAGYGRWFGAPLPDSPALHVLPIGKDGVLYSGRDFPADLLDIATAQTIAPTADDLWLRWHMARAGVLARVVGQGEALPEVAKGGPSLWRAFNREGGNDAVVAALEAHFAETYGWTMAKA
jgi:hypothetical protein